MDAGVSSPTRPRRRADAGSRARQARFRRRRAQGVIAVTVFISEVDLVHELRRRRLIGQFEEPDRNQIQSLIEEHASLHFDE